MSEKMGTKNIRMTDEMMAACGKYAAEYNAGNVNAFVRDAIEFYGKRNTKNGEKRIFVVFCKNVLIQNKFINVILGTPHYYELY